MLADTTRWTAFKTGVAHAFPRVKSLVWALFATLTAWSYADRVPAQLQEAEKILPFTLWGVWLIAAVLLTLGACVPLSAGHRSRMIARAMRLAGIAIVASLLTMWGASFFAYEGRGWVSGKNYFMLAALALLGAYTLGKDTAVKKEVRMDER